MDTTPALSEWPVLPSGDEDGEVYRWREEQFRKCCPKLTHAPLVLGTGWEEQASVLKKRRSGPYRVTSRFPEIRQSWRCPLVLVPIKVRPSPLKSR